MDGRAASLNERRNLEVQQALLKKESRRELIGKILPYAGLAFIFLFFLIVTKGALINEANRANLINQSFTLTLVCVGAAFVYAHGGSDFSIAATCGCGQLAAGLLLTTTDLPVWLCLSACIGVTVLGACMTAGMGLVLGVPVFVGSMCIRYVFSGILSTATQRSTIFISHAKYGYMNNSDLKAFILVAFILVGYYLFEYTALGKNQRAIGGNMLTARQAGTKVRQSILIAYILMGFCVGVAAIFQMFRNGSVSGSSGTGLEFNLLMAIVLGGFPLTGGEKSRLSSAVIGALTVTILSNGLVLWGVDPNIMNGIKGLLFIAIVAVSYDRSMGKLVS
jgi:ribose transport system permease protein